MQVTISAILGAAKVLAIAALLIGASTLTTSALDCPKPHSDWTDVEQKVLQDVCAAASRKSAHPEPRQEKSVVSSGFLEALILDEVFVRAVGRRGLTISNLKIEGKVLLGSTRISNSLSIYHSTFLESLDLSDSIILGSVSFENTDFMSFARFDGARIDGSLRLGEAPDLEPDDRKPMGTYHAARVSGIGTTVSGDVTIEGMTVAEMIDFSRSNIKGEFSVVRTITPGVDLVSAFVDNQVIIVKNDLRHKSTTKGTNYSIGMYSLRSKQTVHLNRNLIDREVVLDSAVIEGDLILIGSHLAKLSAPALRLSGDLCIGQGGNLATSWAPESLLDLRSAQLNGIRAPEDLKYWPSKLNLTNLRLGKYTPSYCNSDPDSDSCPHNPGWFLKLLRLNKDDSGTFQGYQMMEDLLRSRGDKDEAAEVGVARGDWELLNDLKRARILDFSVRLLYRITVGYGYYPQLSLLWIAAFVGVGAIVYRRTPQAYARRDNWGFLYSFDILVPLVRLDESNYEVRLDGFARYYFYFHRLAGWILGSFLLATITGLSITK